MKKQNNQSIFFVPWAVAAVALGVAVSVHGKLGVTILDRPRDVESKPYTDLSSFYDHYLKEHRDPTCRVLHVIGTSLVILTALLRHTQVVAHLSIGVAGGLFLCEYLSPLPNGLIEFAAVFIIAALSGSLLQPQEKFPWQLLVMGYLPAWIGHFFFEDNRPATFIYPTYSLLCDFRMWYQMIKGDLSWSERI
ncbi:Protein of unknown function (DUF962) [Seminavis robusta]|uniref:Uncharacterized protein n=1 Tax=Seminavis robusta TaxID=568900 RepID=A0A9N8EY98_9STRA|nr:Protein of unknown function (DUF962) [Seminavis robusta]|eukprot:Sro1917_g305300.1 Protein of unknown function (DUF962) (192) ;mRNA; f:5897-6472